MNIAEILKDYPTGTKLYSLLHGECELVYVDSNPNVTYPITVEVENARYYFTKDGLWHVEYSDGECILFPSKENRDWSTFKILKKEYEFKPFDKVLVRNYVTEAWNLNLFSYIQDKEYKYVCLSYSHKYCIPYEGNEHLLNTTNNPE